VHRIDDPHLVYGGYGGQTTVLQSRAYLALRQRRVCLLSFWINDTRTYNLITRPFPTRHYWLHTWFKGHVGSQDSRAGQKPKNEALEGNRWISVVIWKLCWNNGV